MDEHVRQRGHYCVMAAAAIVACLSCVTLHAQTDPTRPPDAIPVSGPSAADSDHGELTSILISGARAEAVVGGRLVHVGDRIGHAQVVKISESEVTLRDEHGLHALKLFPGIEKRIIAAGADNSTATTRNSQVKSKR